MLEATIRQATDVWPSVAKILYVPSNETEFNELRAVMNHLIDHIALKTDHDENAALDSLLEVIGQLVEDYEKAHHPELNRSFPLKD